MAATRWYPGQSDVRVVLRSSMSNGLSFYFTDAPSARVNVTIDLDFSTLCRLENGNVPRHMSVSARRRDAAAAFRVIARTQDWWSFDDSRGLDGVGGVQCSVVWKHFQEIVQAFGLRERKT